MSDYGTPPGQQGYSNPYPSPGQPPYGQQMYPGYPGGYPAPLPEHPSGTTVLVLGILSLVTGVTAPFAWYLGHKAEKEIRASGLRYNNESQIQIGKILGIVGTVLMILGVAFVIVYFVVILAVFIPMFSQVR